MNPFNNWGNQRVVVRQYADRTETGVERTGSLWSWVVVIVVLLVAAKWLGI